jgi:enolase
LDFKSKGAAKDPKLMLSGDELMKLYQDLCAKYPIVTIEDPFDQVEGRGLGGGGAGRGSEGGV